MAETIYRHYDRAGLDAQLNNRERVPQFQDYFDRWRADSDAVAANHPVRRDIAYGPTPGQRLDLFVPDRDGPAPLLFFVHGGWWQSLDKADFLFPAPLFLGRGVAYASINYDLAPEATIPEIADQVRRALLWAHRNGAEHGIDPERIVLAGHSAGGHLVTCCLIEDWGRYGLDRLPYRGCVSISGIYDLTPLPLSYQQPVLKLTEEAVTACSPRFRPPTALRDAGTPLVCAVGGTESQEFLDQHDEFLADWRAAGIAVEEVALPGRDHFSAVDAFAEEGHPLAQAALAMVSD